MANDSQKQIGERLRLIRKSKDMTINYVAKETGFTSSFISQLERGLTKASVSALQKITTVLGVNLSVFFKDDIFNDSPQVKDTPTIVRKTDRQKLIYPDSKSLDYLLTGTDSRFEVTYSKIEPDGGSGELLSHEPAEECVIVLAGQLQITIEGNEYILNLGDTITFPSRLPHGWKNTDTVTAELIWIVTPPNY